MNLYEKQIIGGVANNLVLPSAVNLDPSDFEDEDLAGAFRTAAILEGEQVTIDPHILFARCAEQEQGFYGVSDFEGMAKSVRAASVVFEAVDKVKGRSLKAYLLNQAAQISSLEDKTGAEILDRLKSAVDFADREYRSVENNFVFLSDMVPKMQAVYEDLHAGTSYSIPTGFSKLDDAILDGFSKGDEHIIVAFTGQGKSALALNCAKMQAQAGYCVGIVSREMSDIENTMRLQSADADVERWKMRKGLSLTDFYTLTDHLKEFSKLRIAIDTRTTNVESLRPQVRKMVEVHGMAILYVDYLQLMASSKNSTRAEEVAAVSRGLKEIAMENRIPVVSLCQFNRGATNAAIFDLMSFLKESSGIEQDASTIIYLQIEKTKEQKTVKDAAITILKNRNGAMYQEINMRYRGEIFQFYEA